MTTHGSDLWEFITDARERGITDENEIRQARKAENDVNYVSAAQRETRSTAVRHGRRWADTDIEVLKMEHLTVREQARALGRTYQAVKNARIKLGKQGIL